MEGLEVGDLEILRHERADVGLVGGGGGPVGGGEGEAVGGEGGFVPLCGESGGEGREGVGELCIGARLAVLVLEGRRMRYGDG